VSHVGRRVDESSPMVDARLPDGSRVNAIIPPLSVDGPVLTIRKFSPSAYGAADLVANSTMTEEIVDLMSACVRGRLNVLVSGGTGTGKTTLLNVLSSFVPSEERIVTIEDAVELQLHQHHVIRLEARPPNIEGAGEITIRDLVRNALRMRPDRIIVGEVRAGEAFDMLQAMNTGHEGSMTTIHANTPRDALYRLDTMIAMANLNIPARAVKQQVASAVNLIVQVSRMSDGSRKVTHISEIAGMEGDVISLQDLFVFERTGVREDGKVIGRFKSTGLRPRCSDRLTATGIRFDAEMFEHVARVA
jgi:pilus assembly protein CpaF